MGCGNKIAHLWTSPRRSARNGNWCVISFAAIHFKRIIIVDININIDTDIDIIVVVFDFIIVIVVVIADGGGKETVPWSAYQTINWYLVELSNYTFIRLSIHFTIVQTCLKSSFDKCSIK